MSEYSCLDQWINDWSQYNATAYGVLALTFVNLVVLRIIFISGGRGRATMLSSTYERAARVSGFLGLLKGVGGIYLLSVVPVCPVDCQCAAVNNYYPYVAIFLGILWVLRAVAYRAAGRKLASASLPIAQPVVATVASSNTYGGEYTAIGGK